MGDRQTGNWTDGQVLGIGALGALASVLAMVVLYPVQAGQEEAAVLLLVLGVLPTVMGLGIGVASVRLGPPTARQSLATAWLCQAPQAFLANWALNPVGMVGSGLGIAICATLAYSVPRVHVRCVDGGGPATVELERVTVPAAAAVIAVVALVGGTAVLGFAHADTDGCSPQPDLVFPVPVSLSEQTTTEPHASFDYRRFGGAIEITHGGGDAIAADELFVAVDRSSVAWSRIGTTDDGEVSRGESARFPGVAPTETVSVRYHPDYRDCGQVLSTDAGDE